MGCITHLCSSVGTSQSNPYSHAYSNCRDDYSYDYAYEYDFEYDSDSDHNHASDLHKIDVGCSVGISGQMLIIRKNVNHLEKR